jgi:multicomponent K+:H+ antiporter subunit A
MMLELVALPSVPLITAALVVFIPKANRLLLPLLCGTATIAALAVAVHTGSRTLEGEAAQLILPWVPDIGLFISLYVDALSFLFLLLILGVGVLVIAYSYYYLAADEALPRFYASLMFFMASMVGVVIAGNLLLLVVFWELTSISSFLLIGFWDRQAAARKGAFQSLIVTAAGGLAMLAGIIVLGTQAGSFELAELLRRAEEVRALPGASTALALILAGAFTKSAQVPFHFWLPSAMAAPTPVSAYLHSATMVKAGIFLLARLAPIFAATDLWVVAVPAVGAATLLVGGWGALRQTDLKALLAYSTVSQLGMIVMLLGFGSETAAIAATLHILNHAAFKAPLFMAAGIIDHEAGGRDLRNVGGLAAYLPRTALLSCIAAASLVGMPLLGGFVSKELFYEASLAAAQGSLWGLALPVAAVAGGTLTVAYALRLIFGAFFGLPLHENPPHEPPAGMRLPAEALVVAAIAVGILPQLVAGPLVAAAAASVTGTAVDLHLAIWHGWTPALGLSLGATFFGVVVYLSRRDALRVLLPPRLGRTAAEMYEVTFDALLDAARAITDVIQNGSLRAYVRTVLAVALILGFTGAVSAAVAPHLMEATPRIDGALLITLITMAATIAVAVLYRRRLASVLSLGAVGLLVAVYFTWLSAPDLVMTQLLVESVTTILVVLVLYFLPKEIPGHEPVPRLAIDATLALAVGVASASVVYWIMRRPFESISRYHIANSLPRTGGGNVVNVILVDFRGYDTMGEITVLAIGAIGVVALIYAQRRPA